MPDWSSVNPVPWESNRQEIQKTELGEEVTRIGVYAFYECSRLTSIELPKSLTG
ncbi:MAG: leucine-rich repeat protein [Clostridiales bacterium]|nr:leucine-rich repeat protein [Clostridiales bacterium]